MGIENIVKSVSSWKKRNIREGAITQAGAINGLIGGSVALYFGLNKAFVQDYLNTVCNIAGAIGVSGGLAYIGRCVYQELGNMRGVAKLIEKQKSGEIGPIKVEYRKKDNTESDNSS